MGKRKTKPDEEVEDEDEENEVKPVKSKAKKPKQEAAKEPFKDDLGWNVVPPSLIWR